MGKKRTNPKKRKCAETRKVIALAEMAKTNGGIQAHLVNGKQAENTALKFTRYASLAAGGNAVKNQEKFVKDACKGNRGVEKRVRNAIRLIHSTEGKRLKNKAKKKGGGSHGVQLRRRLQKVRKSLDNIDANRALRHWSQNCQNWFRCQDSGVVKKAKNIRRQQLIEMAKKYIISWVFVGQIGTEDLKSRYKAIRIWMARDGEFYVSQSPPPPLVGYQRREFRVVTEEGGFRAERGLTAFSILEPTTGGNAVNWENDGGMGDVVSKESLSQFEVVKRIEQAASTSNAFLKFRHMGKKLKGIAKKCNNIGMEVDEEVLREMTRLGTCRCMTPEEKRLRNRMAGNKEIYPEKWYDVGKCKQEELIPTWQDLGQWPSLENLKEDA